MNRNKNVVWIWARTRTVYGPKLAHRYRPLVFTCTRKGALNDQHSMVVINAELLDAIPVDHLSVRACRHCGGTFIQVGEHGPADPAHISRHRGHLKDYHGLN